MIEIEEIEKYLPQYLTAGASIKLFSELKDFPSNIDSRLYTQFLKDTPIIYQGDGLSGLPSVNLPDPKIGPVPGMILSNTCDVDESNKRFHDSRLVYATIFNLDKYKNLLIRKFVDSGRKSIEDIEEHINKIRNQYISHIFYLPAIGDNVKNESMVMFDTINNLSNKHIDRDDISKQRLFSLSDYGFYLLMYKLSIHFTRIREGVSRSPEDKKSIENTTSYVSDTLSKIKLQ